MRRRNPRSQFAFSLVEMVMVVVVLAVAAVGLGSGFAYISRSFGLNEDLQRSWQIAQECAEHALGQARVPIGSYATVAVASPSAICNALPALPAGYTRVVNVTNVAAGTLCNAGWACKRVQITVTRGSVTSTLNFMIVNY